MSWLLRIAATLWFAGCGLSIAVAQQPFSPLQQPAPPQFLVVSPEEQLWQAVEKQNAAVLARLLQAGADANLRDRGRRTLLYMAAENGDAESIRLLVEHGADVNARMHHGETALHALSSDTNFKGKLLKFLLQNGARSEIADDAGQTPLRKIKQHDAELYHWILARNGGQEPKPRFSP